MTDIVQKGNDAKAAADLLFAEIRSILLGKQDQIAGKGLSEEDFTTVLKTKLDNAVESSDFTNIVKVTESNYPASPVAGVLYIVIPD